MANTPAEPLPVGEDEFRLIADSAPVAVWVTRLDRRRSFVNRAYVAFLGVSYEEALEFDWRQIIHPDDAARLLQESIAGEASLESFALEGRYRSAQGEWRWLHSTSQPRRDAQGRHIGFIGVAHDVTEAKTAELALREREAQLSAFINQTTAGFAQVDIAGNFTLVNDRFCEIAGWSRDELMGMTMQAITHPDDLGRNLPLFEHAVRDGTPYTHEKRYVRKDGGVVWVNNSVAVIRRADGEPFGVLSVTLDVTQRREGEEALRKGEETLRLATEAAGMATWELDLETMEGSWSPNRFDLLGMPRRPDARGSFEEWLDRVHPDDRAAVQEAALRCFTEGTPYTITYRILRADDGAERWLQSHGSRIDYGDSRPSRFVGVSFDVTDRKRAEDELRRSEEGTRLAIEGAGMATWELDLGTMEGEWSANRFDLLGLPRTLDLRGTVEEWLERVHGEDRDRVEAAARRCFDEGVAYAIEYRICRADDRSERWLQSHGSRIDFADGRSSRFVGVSFDITDRKHAEEQLRESEARFRTIFEQANDFLITTTLDNRVTSVNPAVLEAIGYSRDEIIGHSIAEFMDPDQFAISMDAFNRKLQHGGSTRLTVKLRAKDGRELIWEVNSQLSLDDQGHPVALHAIGRDMTEAKRAEAHLRLLVDELNHRVKNTLAIVQGIAQQSFKDDVPPRQARAAFEGRLAALSEAHNLLTREHWSLVSMRQIIDDALRPHGGDAGRFTLDGPDLTILPKTAISLALAIHELATNAVKHGALSRPEGRVAIAWQRVREGGPARLTMRWEEQGGPAVTVPTRRGFGTRMIERGLAAELGGTVKIDFSPKGLICTVDAPLPEGAE
ncbi:PAS domain S-box protein [Sphingomonas sp. KR3-1]|uniref:PAS domain S-box protein n=1 Tax=Sphingomonas sp. KR3-1 TaxID=3156611 RepID=UPI0032B3EC02